MSRAVELPEQGADIPKLYRLLRHLVRIWFALSYPRIRLLCRQNMPATDPVVLAVSHAPSFFDALLLVAALERPVRSLLPQREFQGGWRDAFERALGMIAYDTAGEGSRSALDSCCDVLARREAIAIFAETPGARRGDSGLLGSAAAAIALECVRRHSGQLAPTILPVHLFVPPAPLGELLIYLDRPVRPQEYLARAGDAPQDAGRALATAVDKACQENAFRLQARDLKYFLLDLERVLRADLEADWASRPNWKQSLEGFELSPFVAAWTEQINYLDPGQLVALREGVDEYREGRRRWSLREFEIETGGKWLRSRWGRACIWVESALGLPLAAYGFINHLVAWPLLRWFGSLRKGSAQNHKRVWLLRALLVLGCYAAQVLLCARWFGRSAAGFYAPSLPLTGAYLRRYRWLLRHQTRRALAAFRNPAQAAKLRERRRVLVDDLDRAIQVYAETRERPAD